MTNGYDLQSVARMKFSQPLPPGRTFDIEVALRSGHAVISWFVDDTVIAKARVTLRAHDN